MKLFYYEWKKLWENGSFLKVLILFLVISSIIFLGEINKNKEWLNDYKEIHTTVDSMSISDAKEYIKSEKESIKQSQDIPLFDKIKSLEYIEKEINAIESYPEYRQSIYDKYEENQDISIFADENDIQNEYMKKIVEKYDKLHLTSPMKLQKTMGIQVLFDYYTGDILGIVMLIYLVSVVFIQEDKSGKTEFANTMIKGKTSLFLSKCVTVFCSISIFTVLVFLINLIVSSAFIGNISFDYAIQSVPNYYTVPYALNIWQYMILSLLFKILAYFVLFSIAIIVTKVLSSQIITALTVGVTVIISIWFKENLLGQGIQDILKHINVWAFLRGKTIINNYDLIRFNSFILEIYIVVFAVLIFCLVLFALTLKVKKVEKLLRFRIQRKIKRKPHKLLFYEMKKMWIYQYGIFVFILFIIVQGIIVSNYEKSITTTEYYYQSYINQIGYTITEDTDIKISAEQKRLEDIENQLAVEKDKYKQMALSKQLECKDGFNMYVQRVNSIRQGNKPQYILNDVTYNILFEFTSVSKMIVVLLCLSLGFVVPSIFYKEKDVGIDSLQKTMINGSKKVWNYKLFALLSYIIIMNIIFAVFSLYKISRDSTAILKAPISCLFRYWTFKLNIPIYLFFVLGVIVQCIVLSMFVIIISFLSKKIKNQYALTGGILVLTIVPTVLAEYVYYIGWLKIVHNIIYFFSSYIYVFLILFILLLLLALFAYRKGSKI